MTKEIWAVAEHRDGNLRPITWEAIAASQKLARELNGSVTAVVLGDDVKDLARQMASKKLDRVLVAEHRLLADYTPGKHIKVLKQLVQERNPHLVVIGHSYQGAEYAPRLAAALGRGLISGCIGYEREGERLIFIRQVFNAKMNQKVAFRGAPPYFVTFQTGAFAPDDVESNGRAEIVSVDVELSEADVERKILGLTKAAEGKVNLTEAEIIVAVGRGIGKKENLKMIFELAEALGGAVGASRPVVDAEWLDREHQIGSSGQTVSPKLYIACGISGAIQHLVGMKNSRCIVAINKDPNAPIFKVATYGIVDDLTKVVPALTKLIKGAKGS